MKKAIVLSIMCLMAFSISAQNYVDLGLPSGTMWKTVNETNSKDSSNFYTYAEAVDVFGDKLPTKEQLIELKDKCIWIWNENKKGSTVVGPNGKSIFLPAACHRYCVGDVNRGSYGYIWSSTHDSSNSDWYIVSSGDYGGTAWSLSFDSEETSMVSTPKCLGLSVRLVKKGGSAVKKAKKK